MSIWAMCSSRLCGYKLSLQDTVNGVSIPTPPCCPNCDLMTYCPECGFPILASLNPKDRCEVCNCDMRRAFARSNYPRWLTHDQMSRMTPAQMTPAIRRSDGSFYLVLADLPRRARKDDVSSNLLAEFWYVRDCAADTIESVIVHLTRPPRYFAVVESQLRHVADSLAASLSEGSPLLSNDYEFDGEQLTELCPTIMSALAN